MKNLVPAILGILFTEWSFPGQEDREFQIYFTNLFKEFLKNFKENNVKTNDYTEIEYFENLIQNFQQNQNNYVRIDILPHQLPVFKLRKKKIRIEKSLSVSLDRDEKEVVLSNLHSMNEFKQAINLELSYSQNISKSWLERMFYFKLQEVNIRSNYPEEINFLHSYKEHLNEEFESILKELELVDGYGDNNEPKLRNLIDSIIDDKLAGRSSNKLIIGPQGTGKSSFASLLGRLMDARVITIECGPLTDNGDLFGSYEIIIDPETRQAVTVYTENGFMYASKLANEGHKVVLAIEEYNLLPSETLLKQLNRFFQDRAISSMGGRHEISIKNKNDIVVIMTGNYDFNQDWLNDVGLIRRFEFFEFPLPSTESVMECLFSYVKNLNFNLKLTYEGAERIAEIRDDLVASINERTIRPILSKEIKYPDLFTLRNFAMDLIHNVSLNTAIKRWLVKIILGGIPHELELREEYNNYVKIILKTVEDRLPENITEKIKEN